MKMIDLKLPKRDKSTKIAEPEMSDGPRWPYGMQLRFESEQVDKLPHLEEMKAGDKVMVEGMGEISEISFREETGGKKKYSVSVQLHSVGCDPAKKSRESMGDAMHRMKENNRI